MIKYFSKLKPFHPCKLILIFLLFTSFAFGQPAAGFRLKTIVIDAGHGGKDPGARGAYSVEKDVALSIAKKVDALIKEELPDINVIMTRNSDKFIPLNQRSEIANENKANLFISIHCNSTAEGASGTGTRGVMLLVYGFHRKEEQMEALRENSSIYIEKDYKKNYDGYSESDPTSLIVLNTFMEKYRKQSILFGDLLNKEFVNNDGRRSHGVKEQGVLVLAHSAMPAVLVETGYINNPTEEGYLNSKEGQEAIAASIVRAIKRYKEKINAD
jgi:N-acetylmuramoyl-L-alanine amidase